MIMSKDTPIPTHAVFYPDGGCDSQTVAGWGVHGYFFNNDKAKQGTGNSKALVTAGGYEMGKSGIPDITITNYVDAFGSLTDNATNNSAEAEALYNALKITQQYDIKHTTLICDSQYALNGFSKWMHDWQKLGWRKKDGSPVANSEVWQKTFDLTAELVKDGVNFVTKWVKGHSGNVGNERADTLATAGKMSARNRVPMEVVKISEPKGYWTPKNDKNRMFSHPNWYFAAYDREEGKGPDGRHPYYIGTVRQNDSGGKDLELVGKPISDASFAILYLKEREPTLDIIHDGVELLNIGKPMGVMIAHLDTILKPAVVEELQSYGHNLLLRDRRRRRLVTKDKKSVLTEIDPPGLSFRLVSVLGEVEDIFKSYLSGKQSHIRTTDLTDVIYENSEGKKKTTVKLKGAITGSTKTLQVDGNYRSMDGGEKSIPFILTLGQDLPDRNTLSSLAVEGVKVTLLTWLESGQAARFATVIEANGDMGIWVGPYSNLRILPSPKP